MGILFTIGSKVAIYNDSIYKLQGWCILTNTYICTVDPRFSGPCLSETSIIQNWKMTVLEYFGIGVHSIRVFNGAL